MEPILQHGSVVWVNHWSYLFRKPKPGEIVVVNLNKTELIKRVNKIEGNSYYLLGDNPQDSLDSRKFGLVSKEELKGKVIL